MLRLGCIKASGVLGRAVDPQSGLEGTVRGLGVQGLP